MNGYAYQRAARRGNSGPNSFDDEVGGASAGVYGSGALERKFHGALRVLPWSHTERLGFGGDHGSWAMASVLAAFAGAVTTGERDGLGRRGDPHGAEKGVSDCA